MTKEIRNMIVGMKKISLLLSEIVAIVERFKSKISRVLKRYDEYGSLKPAKRSGRPQKLNDDDIRKHKRELCKNCYTLLAKLCKNMNTYVYMNAL